jgi:hypothetical protein
MRLEFSLADGSRVQAKRSPKSSSVISAKNAGTALTALLTTNIEPSSRTASVDDRQEACSRGNFWSSTWRSLSGWTGSGIWPYMYGGI